MGNLRKGYLSLIDIKEDLSNNHSIIENKGCLIDDNLRVINRMGDLITNLSLSDNVNNSRPVHIVAMPYPAQGHTVPFMQLCKQLATLGGFTITFANTEHIHTRMLQASASGFDNGDGAAAARCGNPPNIRLVSIPGGLPPELLSDASHVVPALEASEALSSPFDLLLRQLNLDGPPVTHILSDAMLSWTQSSADALGVPRLAFWTSSAAVFFVIWHMYHLTLLHNFPSFKAGLQENINKTENTVSWIPGLPPVDVDDLPQILQSDPTDFVYQFMIRQLQSLQRAACILMNTFPALEGQILSALHRTAPSPPILAVGPVLPPTLVDVVGMTNRKPVSKPSYENGKMGEDVNEGLKVTKTVSDNVNGLSTHPAAVVRRITSKPGAVQLDQDAKLSAHAPISNSISFHEHASPGIVSGVHARLDVDSHCCLEGSIFGEDAGCLQWLDDQSPGSVLYISFGSLFRMGEEQFKELAAGVEASGAAFLWSIRPDFVEGGSYADKLPASFVENTKERGMMMPWVPQLEVLTHPSIGGFLTHCGWNSMLESVFMGVPMLCWPDAGERRTNGLLAITLWHTGLDFALPKGGLWAHVISRYELERVIKLLMDGDPSIRSNATALQHAALLSLRKGGSSSQAFELLLTHISHHAKGPFEFNKKS